MSPSMSVSTTVEGVRDIISSTSTGAKSPQEVLKSSTKLDVDWHVTEVGDCMIKTWQVAAKGFLTPEQAAIIRATKEAPEHGNEMDWLSNNLESIRAAHAGQWIAIYGNRVVASSDDLPNLLSQIAAFDKPFVTFIPEEQTEWIFTYAC